MAVLEPVYFNGGLLDVKLIVLFMAEINLSFTAACSPSLLGCLSKTRVAQFAPREPLVTGMG
jgi:hypothetical protein